MRGLRVIWAKSEKEKSYQQLTGLVAGHNGVK